MIEKVDEPDTKPGPRADSAPRASAGAATDKNVMNWKVAEWPVLSINSAADLLFGVVAVLTTPVTLHVTMAAGWMLLIGVVVLLGSTRRGFAKVRIISR